MPSIDEKKKSMLEALETLRKVAPFETDIAMEAMFTIHAVALDAFRYPGGDDDLKKEISSPNVIKMIIGVFGVHSWANWYPYNFYHRAMDILLVFGPILGNQLEDTFVSIVQALSRNIHSQGNSDLFHVVMRCTCGKHIYKDKRVEEVVERTLELLERRKETPDCLYLDFCSALDICVHPGVEFENGSLFPRVMNCVLQRIVEHTYDDEKAQQPHRFLLLRLVGEEATRKMLNRVERPTSKGAKKDLFRAALEELRRPTSGSSTVAAMEMIHATVLNGLQHDGDSTDSTAKFVSNNHFKQQVFSSKVLQTIIDAIIANDEYPLVFFYWAVGIIFVFGHNSNAELCATFSDAFSTLLRDYLSLPSVSNTEPLAAVSAISVKTTWSFFLLVAAHAWGFELGIDSWLETWMGYFLDSTTRKDKTTVDSLYSDFCCAHDNICCSYSGVNFINEDLFPRTVNFVLDSISEHALNKEAQKPARIILRHLVGEFAAEMMADYAELRHYQDAYCAMAA